MTDIIGGEFVSPSDASELTALANTLGPKRVKTKNMEIEAHSPEAIQKLVERRGTKRVGPTRIPYNVAVPKDGGWCN